MHLYFSKNELIFVGCVRYREVPEGIVPHAKYVANIQTLKFCFILHLLGHI